MPTWLTFFVSVFLVVGGLVSLYLAIGLVIGGFKTKARPKMGIAPGEGAGTINVWVTWNPKEFALEVYRLRFSHISPMSDVKEGTFTVTWDNVQTAPFVQTVELPTTFRNLLERDAGERAMFTVEFKTKEEYTLAKSYRLNKFKRVYQGGTLGKMPAIANKLPLMKPDHPTVLSLDFSELTVRRKKLKDLEAAAAAKAKTAAAAAAAKAQAAPAPAAAAAAAPAPAPVAATPAEKPQDTPAAGDGAPKSIRETVAATNAATKPAPEKP